MAERLSLQIDTKAAVESLKRVQNQIKKLDEAIKAFGAGGGIEKAKKSMAGMKVSEQPEKELKEIDAAATKTGTKVKGLADILQKVKAERAKTTANDVNKIAAAATKASSSVTKLRASLSAASSAGGMFSGLTAKVKGFTASVKQASLSSIKFSRGFRLAATAAGAFGVSLGAMGLRDFASGALKVQNSLQSFKNTMMVVKGSTELAADEMNWLKDTTAKMMLPLRESIDSYKKFAAATSLAGIATKESRDIFRGVATAARVMNISAADSKLVFLALEQMVSKGTVQMEELKRQLGDKMPGAVQTFAKSMKLGTAEFLDLVKEGGVGADMIAGFAAELERRFEPGLAEAVKTTAAAMTQLDNAWFMIQESFAGTFFDAITESLFDLGEALQQKAFLEFAENIGYIAGVITNVFIKAITFAVEWADVLAIALAAAFTGQIVSMIGVAAGMFTKLGGGAGKAVPFVIKLIGALTGFNGIVKILGLVKGAMIAFGAATSIAMGPIYLMAAAIAALTVGYFAYSDEIMEFLGLADKQAESADKTTEAINGTTAATANAAEQAKKLAEEEREANEAAEESSTVYDTLSTAATGWGKALGILGDETQDSANAAEEAAREYGDAAIHANELDGTSQGAAGSTAQLGSNMHRSTGWANSYAQALYRAADAARELARAEAAKFDSGTSAVSKPFNSNRSGNTGRGSGSGVTARVRSNAFAGAPHLAGGIANTSALPATEAGNGIPTILHPNEAVIPLTSGGEVPVAVDAGPPPSSSGSGNAGAASKLFNELLTWQDKSNRELVLMREDNKTHTVLLHNDLIALGLFAKDMLNGMVKQIEALRELNSMVRSGGSSGGGGGGSTGGGSSSGGSSYGGSSSGGGGTPSVSVTRDGPNQTATYNDGKGNTITFEFGTVKTLTGSPVSGGVNLRTYADALKSINSDIQIQFDEDGKAIDPVNKEQLLKEARRAIEKTQKNSGLTSSAFGGLDLGGSMFLGGNYAKGSPNVFKDANGSYVNVGIHKDEAVIPLPDGRSVPVDIGSSGAFKRMEKTMQMLMHLQARGNDSSGGREYGRGLSLGQRTGRDRDNPNVNRGPRNVTINKIELHVDGVSDPAEFRATQDQIMQQLAAKLQKTLSTFGTERRTEDPTLRVKEPGSSVTARPF